MVKIETELNSSKISLGRYNVTLGESLGLRFHVTTPIFLIVIPKIIQTYENLTNEESKNLKINGNVLFNLQDNKQKVYSITPYGKIIGLSGTPPDKKISKDNLYVYKNILKNVLTFNDISVGKEEIIKTLTENINFVKYAERIEDGKLKIELNGLEKFLIYCNLDNWVKNPIRLNK